MTSTSVVVSAISLHYSNTPHLKPPPKWVAAIIFSCIGKALRMHPLKLRSPRVTMRERNKADPGENAVHLIRSGPYKIEHEQQVHNADSGTRRNVEEESYGEDSLVPRTDMAEVVRHLRSIVEAMEEKENAEDIRRQWKGLTSVMDKLFFYVCLLSLIIFPPVLFLVVPANFEAS